MQLEKSIVTEVTLTMRGDNYQHLLNILKIVSTNDSPTKSEMSIASNIFNELERLERDL